MGGLSPNAARCGIQGGHKIQAFRATMTNDDISQTIFRYLTMEYFAIWAIMTNLVTEAKTF